MFNEGGIRLRLIRVIAITFALNKIIYFSLSLHLYPSKEIW